MATVKSRLAKDSKPDRLTGLDDDGDSVISYGSGPPPAKGPVKYAWAPSDKVRTSNTVTHKG